jgi:hypothetical protein
MRPQHPPTPEKPPEERKERLCILLHPTQSSPPVVKLPPGILRGLAVSLNPPLLRLLRPRTPVGWRGNSVSLDRLRCQLHQRAGNFLALGFPKGYPLARSAVSVTRKGTIAFPSVRINKNGFRGNKNISLTPLSGWFWRMDRNLSV